MPDDVHEAPVAPIAPVAPVASKFDALVEQWFQDHFPNSVVARATECWNLVSDAKDDLKRRLAAS